MSFLPLLQLLALMADSLFALLVRAFTGGEQGCQVRSEAEVQTGNADQHRASIPTGSRWKLSGALACLRADLSLRCRLRKSCDTVCVCGDCPCFDSITLARFHPLLMTMLCKARACRLE